MKTTNGDILARILKTQAASAASALVAAMLALAPISCGGPPAPEDPSHAPPSAAPPPPAGWRYENSLGVQIEVPAHWAVNEDGCGSDTPTVSRGPHVTLAVGCSTPEKPTKDVAWFFHMPPGASGVDARFPKRAVSLDGVSAERTEGQGEDGRYVGWLTVPSLKAGIGLRVRDPEVARRILDSARVVAVDHNGCPTKRPSEKRPQATHPDAESAMAPSTPTSISVCYYSAQGNALEASARLSGQQATALSAALNRAAEGPNPDVDPKMCLHPPAPPPADAVLLVNDAGGPSTIYVAFSECVGRGLDNGARRGQVKLSLVELVMKPLGLGFHLNGDLND